MYRRPVAFCTECGGEVRYEPYEAEALRAIEDAVYSGGGVATPEQIRELPRRYAIGKRPLSKLLGWGELTYTRLLDGRTPNAEHSNEIIRLLNDPVAYARVLELGRSHGIITNAAYARSRRAVDARLAETGEVFEVPSADGQDESSERTGVDPLKIFAVADRFCALAGGDITPRALQSLMYLAQRDAGDTLFAGEPRPADWGYEYPRIANDYNFDAITRAAARMAHTVIEVDPRDLLADGQGLEGFSCYWEDAEAEGADGVDDLGLGLGLDDEPDAGEDVQDAVWPLFDEDDYVVPAKLKGKKAKKAAKKAAKAAKKAAKGAGCSKAAKKAAKKARKEMKKLEAEIADIELALKAGKSKKKKGKKSPYSKQGKKALKKMLKQRLKRLKSLRTTLAPVAVAVAPAYQAQDLGAADALPAPSASGVTYLHATQDANSATPEAAPDARFATAEASPDARFATAGDPLSPVAAPDARSATADGSLSPVASPDSRLSTGDSRSARADRKPPKSMPPVRHTARALVTDPLSPLTQSDCDRISITYARYGDYSSPALTRLIKL